MRQFIAIAFLSLYLFTSTGFSELLKLPQLVQHYKEHLSDEKLSFSAFLHQHYTQGDVHDADRQKDLKLPYKSIDYSVAIPFLVLPAIVSIEFEKITAFSALKLPINFYTVPFSSNNFSSIWQPPKIVT